MHNLNYYHQNELREAAESILRGQSQNDTSLNEGIEDVKKIVADLKVGDSTNFGKVLEIGSNSITFKAKDLPKTTIPFNQRKMGSSEFILSKIIKLKEAIEEAVEKIACLQCDAVSTAAAWKKNKGFCPVCKTSTQGVLESTIKEEIVELEEGMVSASQINRYIDTQNWKAIDSLTKDLTNDERELWAKYGYDGRTYELIMKSRKSTKKESAIIDDIDEATINWLSDFLPTSEKSNRGGYQPKIIYKSNKGLMYLGQAKYNTPEEAKAHAEDYLKQKSKGIKNPKVPVIGTYTEEIEEENEGLKRKKRADMARVNAGSMSRDDYNKKYKLGKYRQGGNLSGPGGLYKNMTKKA